MGFESIIVILKESTFFFFQLLPYLIVGLFVGSALEVALSKYKEVRWLKRPGVRSYTMVSLLAVGTPL